MNSDLLDCIEVNPAGDPSAAIIWLHGLGADGHDFEAIVPQLRLPASLPVRFVFPHAPQRAVTVNGGVVMRAWFDIYDVDLTADSINHEHFRESVGLLSALIENELQSGMASDRIVLAGFSQGGAIVLHAGLHYENKLAGILALSMHLPTVAQSAAAFSSANRQVPIMMAHGQSDPIIPLPKALETRQALSDLGYAVDWHEYPMPHSVCAEEIEDIRLWLLKILP
ncbi:MAG: dienelactone hydrolase family protein [Desulfobacterales bacterium]